MTSLISELSEDLRDEYMSISQDEVDMLRLQKFKEPDDVILELIGDYQTLKLLQIQKEEEKAKLELDIEKDMYEAKIYYMNVEHMKTTEAKEKARQKCITKNRELIQIEKDIGLLKASIHSIEYQLRYQFKRMTNQTVPVTTLNVEQKQGEE